jgi:hypothetical protein
LLHAERGLQFVGDFEKRHGRDYNRTRLGFWHCGECAPEREESRAGQHRKSEGTG